MIARSRTSWEICARCVSKILLRNYRALRSEPSRPSLESMLEDYWRMMPEYQGVPLESLTPERILFGFFPTYRDSPLKPQFDRILAVGDSSGIQSPLSFGGFGALTRHVERLTAAITEAIEVSSMPWCWNIARLSLPLDI